MTHEEKLVAIARDLTNRLVALRAAESDEAVLNSKLEQARAKVRDLQADLQRDRARLVALAGDMPPVPDVVVAPAAAELPTLTVPAEPKPEPLTLASKQTPAGRRR